MSGSAHSPSRPREFSSSIWLADEAGNIYYARRDTPEPGTEEIVFRRVSTPEQRFDFASRDELYNVPGIGYERTPGTRDGSVAVVKMLLAMGVATAAIPKDGAFLGPEVTTRGTSYVINLASFATKTQAFWPGEGTDLVHLEPAKPR